MKKSMSSIILKKGKKKWIIITAISITVVTLTVGGVHVYRQQNGQVMAAEEVSVQTATASKGDISTTVVGTGSLTYDSATDINIPVGLEIEEVYVDSGDTVKAGDTLAKVSEASVAKELAKIQEEIQSLDEEISDLNEEDETTYLTTSLAGRVKAINGEAGNAVTDVMLEHGAMVTLSLDGYMAVDVATSAEVSVDDSVTVTLSDGSTVSGTVSAAAKGKCTVLLTDDGTALNDTVTVTNSDGGELGSGTLYINKPYNIVAASGNIDSVDVTLNEEVSVDEQLMTLSGAGQSYEYLELLEKREEQEELLQQLLTIAKTNTITAAFDGAVEAVNITASSSSDSAAEDKLAEQTAAEDTSADNAAMQMSSSSTSQYTAVQLTTVDTDTSTMLDASIFATMGIGTPQTGKTVATATADTEQYTGSIQWNTTDATFEGETVYSAEVRLTAKEGYYFDPDIQPQFDDATVSNLAVSNTDTSSVLSFSLTFSATAADTSDSKDESDTEEEADSTEQDNSTDNDSSTDNNDDADKDNNTDKNSTDNSDDAEEDSSADKTDVEEAAPTKESTALESDKEEEKQETPTDSASENQNAVPNTSGTGGSRSTGTTPVATSSSSSSASNSVDSAADSTDSAATDDSDTIAAFSISKQDKVIISIGVDELDILSIEEGQEAEITLDAIEGEVFNGTITNVSTTTGSDGETSYAAEITLEKAENMLAGMSASATITVSDAKDVVKLPINALQERGSQTFVYTEYDESTGELSGEVEIETGLSDGDYVEVVSGLSDGDNVYYTRVGTTSESGGFDRSMMERGEMPQMNGDFNPGDFGGGGSGGQSQRPTE